MLSPNFAALRKPTSSCRRLASAATIAVCTTAALLAVLSVLGSGGGGPDPDLDRFLREQRLEQAAPAPGTMNRTSRCGSDGRVVLITGISGMIGSHVARELLRPGRQPCYDVVGLIRPRSDLSTLAGVLDQIEFVIGDVTDSHRMMAVVDEVGPDLVFHFAAQAVNGISPGMPSATIDANIGGTVNLFEALRRRGARVRVLVAGSSTEYGQAAERHTGPIPETLALDPVTPYGISKAATEQLAQQYGLATGGLIAAVTARLFIHVGVGGTDSLAIHQFCKQAALAEVGLGKPVVRHGNLDTARDMTDARDSASILVALCERGVPGEAYNVGSGNTIAMKELLDQVLRLARVDLGHELDPRLLRPFDERVLVADIAKVRALTDWHPGTDMGETVANILAYWRRKVRALYCVENADGVNPCRMETPDDGNDR